MPSHSKAKKAISPLIATVLLISFTFTIAAILAGWGQNISTQSLGKSEKTSQQLASCGGGTVQYLYTGSANPVMDSSKIRAQIRVGGVPLSNFTFAIALSNSSIVYLSDTSNTSLSPGPRDMGTIVSEATAIAGGNITSVTITTNCPDVRTDARPLG